MRVDTTTVAGSAGDHGVQFYEHDAQLAEVVARWLSDAAAEDVSIVIATPAHRELFAAALAQESGVRESSGRVRWLDAAATFAQFIVEGEIDHAAFDAAVGSVVRDAAQDGRPVRVYGEMVALLWDAGNIVATVELETLWNELARDTPFALLCSYPTAIQADCEHADALDQICGAHSACHHVWPDDGVAVIDGSPTDGARAKFDSRATAPSYARRVATQALRQWGYSAAVTRDTGLVVSELVSNAVRYANSQLTLSVRLENDGALRVAVEDTTPLATTADDHPFPAEPGRGLGIVATLSADWGVESLGDGKIVWAQMQP